MDSDRRASRSSCRRTRRTSPTPARASATGYAFINSYNVEMATGGIQQGKPPIEVGASQLDFDYLHIIDWKKAEQVVAAGKFTELNGIRVIIARDGRRRGAPAPRARAAQPARRRHRAERRLHHRLRQARSARHGLRLRPDQESHRVEELRGQGPLRRADPEVRRGGRRQGRARRRPAAHAVRQQGQRLHQPLPRERGREVDARRAVPSCRQGLQARRQGLDPLQHRPPRHDPGRHDGSAGQVPRSR